VNVDPQIRKALEASSTVDVIVCFDEATNVADQLSQAGLQITDRRQASMGMIYGRVDAACLKRVESIRLVQSVTLDSEQRAF
jgi:hypothetical protein